MITIDNGILITGIHISRSITDNPQIADNTSNTQSNTDMFFDYLIINFLVVLFNKY